MEQWYVWLFRKGGASMSDISPSQYRTTRVPSSKIETCFVCWHAASQHASTQNMQNKISAASSLPHVRGYHLHKCIVMYSEKGHFPNFAKNSSNHFNALFSSVEHRLKLYL